MTVHKVLVNRRSHRVKILERNGKNFLVQVNGKGVRVQIKNQSRDGIVVLEIDGRLFRARIERSRNIILKVKIDGKPFEIQHQPRVLKENTAKLKPAVTLTRKQRTSLPVVKGAVITPIAGRIVLLKVNVGQRVEKGECICILEAMKMENEITAPETGIVKEIRISEGAIVNSEDVLVVIT